MFSTLSPPKSAVFFSSHHSGHLNPMLSLASLFRKNGYTVHFFCTRERQSKLEAFTFHNIHEQTLHETAMSTIQDLFGREPSKRVAGEFFPEQILPSTVAYLQAGLVERVQRLQPTVIVCDVSALWGILVANILKIPLVTSCSCALFDSLDPAFGYMRSIDYLRDCQEWIRQNYSIEYDIPKSYMNESDFVIAWSFPSMQPTCRQRLDGNVHFYGAALPEHIDQVLQEQAMQDPDLTAFIEQAKAQHQKIVYCSLGTVVGQEPWTTAGQEGDMVADFYCRVLRTLGPKKDYRVILSIGPSRKKRDLGLIPDNVCVRNVVPQLYVLEQSDCFITHCGNNGVHEAFFFGCPMVGIPIFGDQHLNASMLVKLGAGVQIASPFAPSPSVNLDHVTEEALCESLSTIMHMSHAACQKIRQDMHQQYNQFHSKSGAWKELSAFLDRERFMEPQKLVPLSTSGIIEATHL